MKITALLLIALFLCSCDDNPYYVQEERRRKLTVSQDEDLPLPISLPCRQVSPGQIFLNGAMAASDPRIRLESPATRNSAITPISVSVSHTQPQKWAHMGCDAHMLREVGFAPPSDIAQAQVQSAQNINVETLILCGNISADRPIHIRAGNLFLYYVLFSGRGRNVQVDVATDILKLVGRSRIHTDRSRGDFSSGGEGDIRWTVSGQVIGNGEMTLASRGYYCPP